MKNYKINKKEKTLIVIINDLRGDILDFISGKELKSYFVDYEETKIIYTFKQPSNTGYSFVAWANEWLDYIEEKNPIFFKRET